MILLEVGLADVFMWLFLGIVLIVIGLVVSRYIFWVHVECYEIGYEYNFKTGKLTVYEKSGYFFVKPFVTAVHTIDCRPMQVKFESDGRICCYKDVRFKRNAEGVIQFIKMKGRRTYDLNTLPEILRSYTFEGCGTKSYSEEDLQIKYKFLEIIPEKSN